MDKQPGERAWLATRGQALGRPFPRPFPISLLLPLETAEQRALGALNVEQPCHSKRCGSIELSSRLHCFFCFRYLYVCMHANRPTGMHFLICSPTSVYFHILLFVCWQDCLQVFNGLCALPSRWFSAHIHLRKHTQNSAKAHLHEDKFISFPTSRHPPISCPATCVTSANGRPVIRPDSGGCLPGCQLSKWSEC